MSDHPPTAGLDGSAGNGPPILLGDHHLRIEEVCRELRACAYEDCSRDLVAQYRVLEHAVLEHMEEEETAILPDFAVHDPATATAILDEHAAIRKVLLEIGTEVELHVVRLETLQRLIDLLHEHAAREDVSMYPWAQVHLPLSAKRRMVQRLRRSLHALGELLPAWTEVPAVRTDSSAR